MNPNTMEALVLGVCMSNQTIDNKLDNQLYSHINETIREPTLIVMHPDTCKALWASVWSVDKKRMLEYDNLDTPVDVTYKGVKVLRSSDVPVGMFEVR